MKQLITVSLVFTLVVFMMSGCAQNSVPEIRAGLDSCDGCNMVIDKVNEASGYMMEGEFLTFDSPACLLRSYDNRRNSGQQLPSRIFFADYSTSRLIPSDSTSFLLTEHIPTVMNGRVLCFSDEAGAIAIKEFDDEAITDWMGYRIERSKPDKTFKATVGTEGFEPDTFEMEKGEIGLWVFSTTEMEQSYNMSIRGLTELGEVTLNKEDGEVKFRMMATLPGAGFPMIDSESGTVLGVLKVSGSHTPDEEQQ